MTEVTEGTTIHANDSLFKRVAKKFLPSQSEPLVTETTPPPSDLDKFWQKEPSQIAESVRLLQLQTLLTTYIDDEHVDSVGDSSIEAVYAFLQQDPLTDQQAGSVARYMEFERRERRQKNTLIRPLSIEERKFIIAGNWQHIEQILTSDPARKTLWDRSRALEINDPTPKTVYRAMALQHDELINVRDRGVVAEGINRNGSVYETLKDNMNFEHTLVHIKKERGATLDEIQDYILERLLLTKANIFRDVWAMPAFEIGMMSSPVKMGLSTTTKEKLKNQRGSFFGGNNVVEINVPGNRLVLTDHEGQANSEEERTILFYVPPENIQLYGLQDGKDSIWNRMKKLKA